MKTENLFIALSASALIAGVVLKDKITPEPKLMAHVEKTATEEKPCVFMSVMGNSP